MSCSLRACFCCLAVWLSVHGLCAHAFVYVFVLCCCLRVAHACLSVCWLVCLLFVYKFLCLCNLLGRFVVWLFICVGFCLFFSC